MNRESTIQYLSLFVSHAREGNWEKGDGTWFEAIWREFQRFTRDYGLCPSGHLFSFRYMICKECGSDIYEVWDDTKTAPSEL